MIETRVAIIGAGPAGLAAAVETSRAGLSTLLIDEQERPGGQLVKQIHKFFGSREHYANVRGIDIGNQLLTAAQNQGVRTLLNTIAYGLFGDGHIGIYDRSRGVLGIVKADRIILATGASENPLWFPGWTLPGVMGAGAFQTMVNVHRVLPGKKIVMIGSGNVGLIVAYQALQAGAEVVAVCEILSNVGGYHVHAAKLRRQGIPFLLQTTVEQAIGKDQVERVVLVRLGEDGKPNPRTAREVKADTVCVSVGLSPLAELAWMAGCRFSHLPELGGWVPVHDEWMKTTAENIWIAGDLTGIEEASTALEEGRLAGLGVLYSLGGVEERAALEKGEETRKRLSELRKGPFGEFRRKAKEKLKGETSFH